MVSSIYVKFPDASGIKAETEQAGYEGQVAASSIQWGVGRAISTVGVGNSARETGLPSFSEVTFTTYFDSASNDLATAATKGKAMDLVTITFLKDTGDDPLSYLTYELENVLISSYSMSSGGETPMLSISLNFDKIKSVYKKQGSDHTKASEHEFEYDIRKIA